MNLGISKFFDDKKNVLGGLLLFLPGTFYFSSHYLIFFLLWCLLFFPKKHIRWQVISLSIVTVLCFLNICCRMLQTEVLLNPVPYTLGILISVFAVSNLNDYNFLKYFIYLVLIECIVCAFEFTFDVRSLFNKEKTVFLDSNLWYNKSVCGLGMNSPGTGLKFCITYILYWWLNKKHNITVINPYLFTVLIGIGLFTTFVRTAFIGVFVFVTLWGSLLLFKDSVHKFRNIILLLILFSVSGLYLCYKPEIIESIMFQLTRGNGDHTLSERDVVYPFYWDYITDNLWFGHGSTHAYFDIFSDGRMFHAHNSFLQYFADNGIFIAFAVFMILFVSIKMSYIIYILPFFCMAIFQHILLWGMSLSDTVFWIIIFGSSTSSKILPQKMK